MNNFSKIVIGILIVICCFWLKDTFFPQITFDNTIEKLHIKNKVDKIKPDVFNEELTLSKEGEKILGKSEEQEKIENTAKIYFLKLNSDGTSDMYISKRELKTMDLNTAIKSLLKGPTSEEKKKGVYTEVPSGTKLLSVIQSDDKIIINMNDAFQYGGGSESINNRLKQLIKTVIAIHPEKNLYLYINGKEIDVMGGDGVMITQPLSLSDF